MKVWDLHCDTLSELRRAEKAGRPKSFLSISSWVPATRLPLSITGKGIPTAAASSRVASFWAMAPRTQKVTEISGYAAAMASASTRSKPISPALSVRYTSFPPRRKSRQK